MDIYFVLVRPTVAENVGAAARAIKTMGFNRLRIVDSQQHLAKPATILAHGAGDVLEGVECYATLALALADIDLSIASSAKARLGRRYSYAASELAEQIQRKGSSISRVAVVFGCESSGLSNEDLNHCDMLSHVPIAQPYPSLNLAQAVMIYAYSLNTLQHSVVESDVSDGQWRSLKDRSKQLLSRLSVTPESKLSQWAMERLVVLNNNDVKFLHLLFNQLEKGAVFTPKDNKKNER